jgi:hypothetical protein
MGRALHAKLRSIHDSWSQTRDDAYAGDHFDLADEFSEDRRQPLFIGSPTRN